MAIVKIKPIKKKVDNAIKYITNKEKVQNENYGVKREDLLSSLNYIEKDFKTQNKEFVSSLNCIVDDAYNQMQITKETFNKKDGILAFHIIQSFDHEEVTPELAHKLGIEFAKELFGDRFEVVISTHLNTEHYHNHMIVNSVSCIDGKKFYANRESYAIMRKVNDNLCKEYNLSILKEKPSKVGNIDYQHYYNNYEMKNNYKNSTKHDIDLAIAQAYSFIDFKELMNKLNYEVMIRYGKISVIEKSYKRNIRIERAFGEDYSVDNIKRRIVEETSVRLPFIENYKFKKPHIYQKYCKRNYTKSKRELSSFARLYYHYCHLLKVYSNNNNIKSRQISTKLKHEVEKMAMYSKHAIFLNNNNINSINELDNLSIKKSDKLEELISYRKKLNINKKKEKDEPKIQKLENEITNITNQINLVKLDLCTIEEIEDDYSRIKQMVKEINEIQEKQRNKEKERKRLL